MNTSPPRSPFEFPYLRSALAATQDLTAGPKVPGVVNFYTPHG